MDQEQLISWVAQIEKKFPVEEMRFRRRPVWPILRLFLISKPAKRASESRKIREKSFLTRILSDRQQKNCVESHFSKSGILFFDQSSKYTQYRGQSFHRFFDPLRENLEEGIDYCRLFWNDDASAVNPELNAVFSIGHLYAQAQDEPLKFSRVGNRLSEKIVVILEEWERLTGRCLDHSLILKNLSIYSKLTHLFQRALNGRQLTVFITCFYSIPAFALTTAVQEEGGITIELQHGQQGATHPMYTRWHNRSGESYSMIPKVFWMWNRTGVERIESWGNSFGVRAVEGGNPWLNLFNCSDNTKSSNAKSTIVFSMQFSELPEFVWQAIRQIKDFHWILRMHPRFFSDYETFKAECKTRLGEVKNWEIQTTGIDFYETIREADLHLTGWSTTAFEALHFGVPTILVHPNGRTSMAREIADGVFSYADSLNELEDAISRWTKNRSPRNAVELTRKNPAETFTLLIEELNP